MSPRVLLALRCLLGALFLWAAVAKLHAPLAFFHSLLEYRLPLSDEALRFVAVTLPWLEAVGGAVLLAGVWDVAARWLAVGMSVAFVAATGQAAARGLEITCGCFGVRAGMWDTVEFALVRAVALLVVSAVLVVAAKRASTRPEA